MLRVLKVPTSLLQLRCLFSQELFSTDCSLLWHVSICYCEGLFAIPYVVCIKWYILGGIKQKKLYTNFFINFDVSKVCAVTCGYVKMYGCIGWAIFSHANIKIYFSVATSAIVCSYLWRFSDAKRAAAITKNLVVACSSAAIRPKKTLKSRWMILTRLIRENLSNRTPKLDTL
jgi:hypothetical protein